MAHFKATLAALLVSVSLSAHPMGNFSISHYTRLEFKKQEIQVTYILDFAEIPTLELLQKWGVAADRRDEETTAAIRQKARLEAAGWLDNLRLFLNGERVPVRLKDVHTTLTDGAGGMAVMRVEMLTAAPAERGGELTVEDSNYPNRTGWKEIVVRSEDGVSVARSSVASTDLSKALTQYPADPGIVPPQDVRATVSWSVPGGASTPATGLSASALPAVQKPRSQNQPVGLPPHEVTAPVAEAKAANQPLSVSAGAAGSFGAQQPGAPGTVVAGDYLSTMLRNRSFGFGAVLLGLLAAFTLGAFHALSPGHGKTIVAAYLVGSRGTMKHAAFLGFMVTFTHTVSVFLLGLGVLFFQQYLVPDRVIPILGVISGLSIVAIGGWLLYGRAMALTAGHGQGHTHEHPVHRHHDHGHSHDHAHAHDHSHAHAHAHGHPHLHEHGASARVTHASQTTLLTAEEGSAHSHDHGHTHPHIHEHGHGPHDHAHPHHHHDGGFVHTHTHNGLTHSHVVPDSKISFGGLVALGASGGLVPCPSALILMLSAIALGHAALGLALLASFSAGLALVLMAVGGLVLFAKSRLPNAGRAGNHPIFRLAPIFSAVVVMVLGVLMTLSAAGVLKPIRFLA